MFASLRVSCGLALYAAFVIATFAACHSLLHTTAKSISVLSHDKLAAAAPAQSRVELWLQKQSAAGLKKSKDTQTANYAVRPAPERDLEQAIVLATAMDEIEHNSSELAQAREIPVRRTRNHVRVPACHALPCDRNALLPQETAELKPQLKANPRRVTERLAKPGKKDVPQIAAADEVTIESKSAPRVLKMFALKTKTQTVAVAAKIGTKARVKSEKKIALRRFKETPAEISYRSFVGTFVPST